MAQTRYIFETKENLDKAIQEAFGEGEKGYYDVEGLTLYYSTHGSNVIDSWRRNVFMSHGAKPEFF